MMPGPFERRLPAIVVVVVVVVAMTPRIQDIEQQVHRRWPVGRPRNGVHLIHAALGPIAHAVGEDGSEPRALLSGERHFVIGHVDRLELALDDVERDRRAGDVLRRHAAREERVAQVRSGRVKEHLRRDDLYASVVQQASTTSAGLSATTFSARERFEVSLTTLVSQSPIWSSSSSLGARLPTITWLSKWPFALISRCRIANEW